MNTRKQIKSVIVALLLTVMPLALIGCGTTSTVGDAQQTHGSEFTEQHALTDTQALRIDMYN